MSELKKVTLAVGLWLFYTAVIWILGYLVSAFITWDLVIYHPTMARCYIAFVGLAVGGIIIDFASKGGFDEDPN